MLDAPLGVRPGFLRTIVNAYAAGAMDWASRRSLATYSARHSGGTLRKRPTVTVSIAPIETRRYIEVRPMRRRSAASSTVRSTTSPEVVEELITNLSLVIDALSLVIDAALPLTDRPAVFTRAGSRSERKLGISGSGGVTGSGVGPGLEDQDDGFVQGAAPGVAFTLLVALLAAVAGPSGPELAEGD